MNQWGTPELDPVNQQSAETREAIFGYVTGRDAEGALEEGDLRAQLIAAYGTSKRDPSRPDTAAAAKGLGVSTRTVQRWLKGTTGLTKKHRAAVASNSRRAMTTKAGRRRVDKASPPLSAPRGKNAIVIEGVQGIVSGITDNYRDRTTAVQIHPDDLEDLRAMWLEHGEAGATAFLHQHYSQHYMEGWHFRSIEAIKWGNSVHYN